MIPGLGTSLGNGMEMEGNGKPLQYLAWRIPWTEEPGGLIHGVARVRHDLAIKPPPLDIRIC